ncbi:MAG: hypothetical protein ACREJ5_31845 [Geminicoccaceae bacterium]
MTAQQALPQPTAPPPGPVQTTPLATVARARADEAAAFERAGFEAILERRLDDAIAAFESARAVSPDDHNVDEIAAYLARVKATRHRSITPTGPRSIAPSRPGTLGNTG